MAIPLIYNVRSVKARWTSTIVAILGIAGTVGVFVAMLSLARGFKQTLVSSGSAGNVLALRAGSPTEMMGGITLESVKLVQDKPGVARDANGAPLVTQEVVGVVPFPLISTGTDANVQVRGVSPNVLNVRPFVKMAEGRSFQPGLTELIVGKNASKTYLGMKVGDTLNLGGGHWKVVGVFDAGGSSFDSEVWCDSKILNEILKRPDNVFQSATIHLTSAADFQAFKDAVSKDPQLDLDVVREVDYYSKQSEQMTTLIKYLGSVVAIIMAFGAVFAALNTMYSAVAERGREIATMRAVGFGGSSVVVSFLIEALLISLLGGILGCLAVLPLNGLTTQALNFQTFSSLAFAFTITVDLLGWGVLFALLMGVLGGLPPAIRAASRPVAATLRSL